MKISPTMALAISKESNEILARWWCELNSHRHPHGMPKTDDVAWQIMNAISDHIGFKACLREWNRDTMNDEEFETFWRKRR